MWIFYEWNKSVISTRVFHGRGSCFGHPKLSCGVFRYASLSYQIHSVKCQLEVSIIFDIRVPEHGR